MGKHILITGGAGFVGSHLADELLAAGHRVRALDSLEVQVHGEGRSRPVYLDRDVELVIGDVRDGDVVRRALDGIDAVYHCASAVGVGQSMYEVARYTDVNAMGTAVLLEELVRRPIERLVVASSMSIYGEGLYRRPDGTLELAAERSVEQIRAGKWEPVGPDGEPLEPLPTPETKPPCLSSVYALGKYGQERLCLMIGRAYDIPTVALRFFNVYGPRQALSNPYTGVLAIFASRLLNGRAPAIFEDGGQQRDFVSVYDVARACRLAIETPGAAGAVLNIGSGDRQTVREIAERMAAVLGKEYIEPDVTGQYRVGDIRHCYADIGRAREMLGFEPAVAFDDGLAELAGWLEGQIALDRVDDARAQLAARGLAV
ncbi:MAG TPA: NAD-dependent epimerase/dehydratase family protein [Gemmatimonadaceae bacterium]|nr:NAD-dependent epimerase/dehydratase family protein [Gemmatimonadaceae bacterium]